MVSEVTQRRNTDAPTGRFSDPQRASARTPKNGPADRREAALVTTAKSSRQIIEVVDEKTGEIQRFRLDHRRGEYVQMLEADEARFNRFALQRSAAKLLPNHRVSKCLHNLTAKDGEVAVLLSKEHRKAHYSGLQTCGCVWVCNCCNTKVSERRKLEARHAIDTHLAAGGGVYMVTWTFPHDRFDVLKDMMQRLRFAKKKVSSHRTYSELRKHFDHIGTIRALEVTHGNKNGWHPHFHEIWLFSRVLTPAELEVFRSALFKVWKASCNGAGLPEPSEDHGIHVQPAESAAEYIAKWGVEPKWEASSELTKANSKRSRSPKTKGRTPFDLLRSYAEGDSRAGALFVEFSEAFAGFAQLYWSQGLKTLFGINDMTDDEIAAQEEDSAVELGRIKADQWRRVLKQPFEARALILKLAESGGWESVELYLSSLSSPS